MAKTKASSARSRARDLIVQSLYQQQLTGHELDELLRQFHQRPDYERTDRGYYDATLAAICEDATSLEVSIGKFADRPIEQLDPVERAILLLGIYELSARSDIPYKVVINESINLAKKFGALDGHKYINAVLDNAVKTLRPDK